MSVSTSLSSPDLSLFLFSLPVALAALAMTVPLVGADLHTSIGGLLASGSGRHYASWEQLILERKRRKAGGGTLCLGHI